MACENKITKNIISDCSTQPIGGIEQVVYLVNRTDIDTITYDGSNGSLVLDFSLLAGSTAFKLKGLKKGLSCGSDRTVAEDMADTFIHKLTFKAFEFDSASIENIDHMNDLVAIVERKDKQSNDGIFVMYGLGTGLYVSADTVTSNDANGTRSIELSTLYSEKNSQNNLLATDYATTKALLEALL